LDLGKDAGPVLKALQAKGILGGVALSRYYPERKNEILVAVTEVKKKATLDKYVSALKEVLA
jgi:glycine dehydrogenase subunit 1